MSSFCARCDLITMVGVICSFCDHGRNTAGCGDSNGATGDEQSKAGTGHRQERNADKVERDLRARCRKQMPPAPAGGQAHCHRARRSRST